MDECHPSDGQHRDDNPAQQPCKNRGGHRMGLGSQPPRWRHGALALALAAAAVAAALDITATGVVAVHG